MPRRAVAVNARVRTVVVPVIAAGIVRVRALGADTHPITIRCPAGGGFAVFTHWSLRFALQVQTTRY